MLISNNVDLIGLMKHDDYFLKKLTHSNINHRNVYGKTALDIAESLLDRAFIRNRYDVEIWIEKVSECGWYESFDCIAILVKEVIMTFIMTFIMTVFMTFIMTVFMTFIMTVTMTALLIILSSDWWKILYILEGMNMDIMEIMDMGMDITEIMGMDILEDITITMDNKLKLEFLKLNTSR